MHDVPRRQGRRRSATSWSTGCSRRRNTAYFFANKWADILRVKRRGQPDRAARHLRLPRLDSRGDRRRQAVRPSSPARSWPPPATRRKSPPTVWYKELQKPEQFVDDTAQVFLGLRMACAQCHHHPYEKWSQDDYWGLAAFFGRVGRKNVADARRRRRTSRQRSVQVIFTKPTGTVTNKRTGKPADDQAARRRADGGRRRTTTRGRSWSTGWSTRRTRSSPGPSPTATGRTSSAAASSIRSTTCASPTRRRNPELLDALAKELGRQQVQPEAPDQDDRARAGPTSSARRRTSSTSTTSRPTPATIRSACRPRCCSTRSAR